MDKINKFEQNLREMKIAITSQNQRTVSGHAGKTTRFVVFEVEHKNITDKSLIELDILRF